MMKYFLLKSEPSEYSFDDLLRERSTIWSGVTAAPALKHLRSMKEGDRAFFYHTGKEKQIVGIVTIASNPYPDPNFDNEKLIVVDILPKERLPFPVSLSTIKNVKELQTMPLVRIGRLSVQPVQTSEWEKIISLSKKNTL